jgi:hypothetical protein
MEDVAQNVWIVDRDREVYENIRSMLVEFDYTAEHRPDVVRALDELSKMKDGLPHVVIVGATEDGFGGDVFVHCLRRLGRPWSTKVVVIGLVDGDEATSKEAYDNEGVVSIDRRKLNDVDLVAKVLRALVDRENTGAYKLGAKLRT